MAGMTGKKKDNPKKTMPYTRPNKPGGGGKKSPKKPRFDQVGGRDGGTY